MKKKILSCLLMLCMLLTPVLLVSCDEEPDATPPTTTPADNTPSSGNGNPSSPSKKPTAKQLEKQLSDALDKLNALEELDCKYVITAEYLMDGVTMTMPITMIMKGKNLTSADPIMYTDVSFSMMGNSFAMTQYHEDGWDYTVMDGETYKMQSEAGLDEDEELMDGLMTDLEGTEILDMTKLTYKNNADGSRTVTTEIDGEKFQEVFAEAMEFMDEYAAMGENTNVEIRDASISFTIKNGYVISYTMQYTMDLLIDGTEAVCNMEGTVEVFNPGQPVTITPPEGYLDFEDISDLLA